MASTRELKHGCACHKTWSYMPYYMHGHLFNGTNGTTSCIDGKDIPSMPSTYAWAFVQWHRLNIHRRDKSSCKLFDTTNNFFPELGRPNNNPKPPEQSALKILEEAGRRPHGFSASNNINAHIPDAKPAPTDFGTCGGTHQFTTPE